MRVNPTFHLVLISPIMEPPWSEVKIKFPPIQASPIRNFLHWIRILSLAFRWNDRKSSTSETFRQHFPPGWDDQERSNWMIQHSRWQILFARDGNHSLNTPPSLSLAPPFHFPPFPPPPRAPPPKLHVSPSLVRFRFPSYQQLSTLTNNNSVSKQLSPV